MSTTPDKNRDFLHVMVDEFFEKLVGERLTLDGNEYVLCHKLGAGGQGMAYTARLADNDSEDYVAKILFDRDGVELDRAFREIDFADLEHPNLVKPLGIGSNPDRLVGIVYRRVHGPSLQEYLKQTGPLPMKTVLAWGMQLADVLAFLHGQGIIHRDVKPSNILVETESQTVKLTDFGLSVNLYDRDSLTQVGRVVGTLEYLSPERISSGVISPQSDIFSLGIVLHEMATGNRLREVTQIAVADPEFAKVISCCLQPDQSDRYASAELLRDDLESLSIGKPAANARRMINRKRCWFGFKIAASLLVAGFLGVAIFRGFGTPNPEPDLSETESLPESRLNFRPDAQGYQPFRLLKEEDIPKPMSPYEYTDRMVDILLMGSKTKAEDESEKSDKENEDLAADPEATEDP